MTSMNALKNRGSRARTALTSRLFRRSGAATLELALTLSILFSICYGLIEYGYYFYVKNTMEGAAREGCRAGIVTGATLSAANTAVETQLQAANLVPNGTAPPDPGRAPSAITPLITAIRPPPARPLPRQTCLQ